jgi:hypothetical protein
MRLSRYHVWRWLSSGMLHRVVWDCTRLHEATRQKAAILIVVFVAVVLVLNASYSRLVEGHEKAPYSREGTGLCVAVGGWRFVYSGDCQGVLVAVRLPAIT